MATLALGDAGRRGRGVNDYLTAQEIAAMTGLALGSVYRLAHDYAWRRTSTKPRGYWSRDVLDTARGLREAQTHVAEGKRGV